MCCWHDEYLTFPSFLKVLATNPLTGNAVAIGGVNVVVKPVIVKINKYGGPMCADNRHAVRVDLVVKPRSGTSVVSVTDPFMVLTRIEKAPNAWLVHLKANTNTIPAHVATVVVHTTSGDQAFPVDIPAFTCGES